MRIWRRPFDGVLPCPTPGASTSNCFDWRWFVVATFFVAQLLQIPSVVIATGFGSTPAFILSAFNASISENVSIGTSVIRIEATDADGGPLDYSIHDSSGHFVINALTGDITTAKTLNREATDQYSFKASVTDYLHKSETQVFIAIQDVNDNTPVCYPTELKIHVPEAESPGKFLTRINCTDADLGSNSQLAFLVDGGTITIDNKTGFVFLQKTLDYERERTYRENITASDSGSPSLSSTFTIFLLIDPVNEYSPVFEQSSYNVTLQLPARTGSPFLTVTAKDLDEGRDGQVEYNISGGSDSFSVNKSTGELYPKPQIWNYCTSYVLNIEAQDLGKQPKKTRVKVHVQLQFTPTCRSRLVKVPVLESIPVGTMIFSSNCSDVNGNLMVYTLQKDGPFKINKFGDVYLVKSLDYEVQDEYKLTVTAKKRCLKHSNTTTATITVSVSGINEFSPGFSNVTYNISVSEDAQFGQTVGRVWALDRDKGKDGEVTYLLTGENHTTFSIDSTTGDLILIALLDRESVGSYTVGLKAKDASILNPKSSTAIVFISVTDINDNPPECSPSLYTGKLLTPVSAAVYTVKLKEGEAKPFQSLINLGCSDPDAGQNGRLSYHLIPGNYTDLVDINKTSGVLILSAELDFESKPSFHFTAIASDHGIPEHSHNVTILISVEPTNEFAPRFIAPKLNVSLWENTPIGYSITRLLVTDKDKGRDGTVRFTIANGNQNKTFAINEESGEIVLTRALDREKVTNYVMVIQATDMGSPAKYSTIEVILHILDVNDNSPVCRNSTVTVSISNDRLAKDVVELQCSDADVAENSRLSYRISYVGKMPLFTVNERGVIRASDKIIPPISVFTVTVKDSGMPELSTRVLVAVLTETVSKKLSFQKTIFQLQIPEKTRIGVTLMIFNCTPVNEGELITYSSMQRTHQSESQFFLVRRGKLSLKRSLQYQETNLYGLTVSCRSSAPSVEPGYAYVSIEVIRQIHCFPRVYGRLLRSSAAPGYTIAKLNCSRLNIQYSFETAGWEDSFVVNDTGHIILQSYPKTQSQTLILHVIAAARNRPNHNTTVTAFIYLLGDQQKDQLPVVEESSDNMHWYNYSVLIEMPTMNLDQWIEGGYREVRALLVLSATIYCLKQANKCSRPANGANNLALFQYTDVRAVQQKEKLQSGNRELIVTVYMTFPGTNQLVPSETLVEITQYARGSPAGASVIIGKIQQGRFTSANGDDSSQQTKPETLLAIAIAPSSVLLAICIILVVILCWRHKKHKKNRLASAVLPFVHNDEGLPVARTSAPLTSASRASGNEEAPPDEERYRSDHDLAKRSSFSFASVSKIPGASIAIDLPGAVKDESERKSELAHVRLSTLRRQQTEILHKINAVRPIAVVPTIDLLQSDDSGIDFDATTYTLPATSGNCTSLPEEDSANKP